MFIKCYLVNYLVAFLFFFPLQYISALRPPKLKSSMSPRSSLDSETEDESMNPKHSILSRRRASLTYFRPLFPRDTFQCRSLQDFSATVARTMEEELKLQHKQTSLAQPGSSMSDRHFDMSMSSETSTESNTTPDINNEWKEVDYYFFP